MMQPRTFLAMVLGSTLIVSGCSRTPETQVPPGTRGLARTLSILTDRPPQHPNVLRVLFYGQSISTPAWTDIAARGIYRRFPGTHFVIANRAIGGFAANLLERTAKRDVTEFYPDLIVFHAYGDHRAYERIIRMIRANTAAEIIIQTDHVTAPVEPMCDEGLHLALTPPPGCRGMIWFRQNNWEQHMSGAVLPRYAQEYGLALEDRRPLWNAYLRRHDLPPDALLADGLHPNATGWKLMAKLWLTFIDRQVAAYRGERSTLVQSLPKPSANGDTVTVNGNRVELLADGPLDGEVEALVDDRPPSAQDGCWQDSRTTSVPGIPEWPLIRQVGIARGVHRADRWTAELTAISPDSKDFAFRLSSRVRGPDGEGTGKADFVSPSGEVTIDAADWVIPAAHEAHGVTLPVGATINWERHFVCRDQPVIDQHGAQVEIRHVVATGMTNGSHRVTLKLSPTARARIREIRVYRPPLKEVGA